MPRHGSLGFGRVRNHRPIHLAPVKKKKKKNNTSDRSFSRDRLPQFPRASVLSSPRGVLGKGACCTSVCRTGCPWPNSFALQAMLQLRFAVCKLPAEDTARDKPKSQIFTEQSSQHVKDGIAIRTWTSLVHQAVCWFQVLSSKRQATKGCCYLADVNEQIRNPIILRSELCAKCLLSVGISALSPKLLSRSGPFVFETATHKQVVEQRVDVERREDNISLDQLLHVRVTEPAKEAAAGCECRVGENDQKNALELLAP